MMLNSQEFYDKILDGWERSESSNGVPYYINHNSEKTQWDHPVFAKLLEELVDMNNVRYAAYRTSIKLRFIQKKFTLDLIDIRTINVVFGRHGYRQQDDTVVDCASLHAILVDLCNTNRVQNRGVSVNNLDTIGEILLNWLLNLYDTNRTGCLRVSSIKIALAALCSARISEKYTYFFSQLCDSTNHITRKKMNLFLHNIMQIPELINESAPFGGLNIAPAVESCFNTAWKPGSITEDEFIRWLLKEPQTIVWLPTLHRLAAADTVKHEAKCSICKAFPIVGFRYRCLKCFNYDICQVCFFTGRINKKHKLKHPTQEYCFATTAKQDTKDFMKTVRNNISKKHRNKKKLRYLPVRGTDQPYRTDNDNEDNEDDEEYDRGVLRPGVLPQHGEDDDSAESEEEEQENVSPVIHNDLQKQPPTRHRPNTIPNYNNMLKDLEQENRRLRQQFDQLTQSALPTQPTISYPLQPLMYPVSHDIQSRSPDTDSRSHDLDSQSGSEASEVEWLREERERLEAKQEVLESHNKQLELQLYRLRLLLKEDGDGQTNSPSPPQHEGSNSPRNPPPTSPKHPPPPYQATPTGRPSQALSQSLAHSHVNRESLVNRYEPSPNDSCVNDTTLDNATFDQTDNALQYTHYSLPSPSQSRYFPEEEAELEELMHKLDQAFPMDMTHSLLTNSRSALDDMYSAANKIGTAFSGFVGNLPDKADDKPDGEEDEITEGDPEFMYETGDMTADSNTTNTLQYSAHSKTVSPLAS